MLLLVNLLHALCIKNELEYAISRRKRHNFLGSDIDPQTPSYRGRPGIPCRGSTSLEQFAISRTSYNISHHLPTRTQGFPVPSELR